MNSRSVFVTSLFVVVSISGCSSLDCCHWWGRNTDGSSNLGKKPAPIQQGPIVGTYNNPGASNLTSTIQQPIQPTTTPIVTSIPVQTYSPTVEQNNSALTPPAPPSSSLQNMAPSLPGTTTQVDNRTKAPSGGGFPPNQLPAAIVTDLPENKPSIPSPMLPTPQVSGPTIPGAAGVDSSPMPLLLAPQVSPGQNSYATTPSQPALSIPEVAVPTIAKPMDIATPKLAVTGKNMMLNPGTIPPPLPSPPIPPVFDGKR